MKHPKIIGRNIRPDMTPGGMAKSVGRSQSERNTQRDRAAYDRRHYDASRAVCEAANAVLEGRRFIRNPDPMRAQISRECREAAGSVMPV